MRKGSVRFVLFGNQSVLYFTIILMSSLKKYKTFSECTMSHLCTCSVCMCFSGAEVSQGSHYPPVPHMAAPRNYPRTIMHFCHSVVNSWAVSVNLCCSNINCAVWPEHACRQDPTETNSVQNRTRFENLIHEQWCECVPYRWFEWFPIQHRSTSVIGCVDGSLDNPRNASVPLHSRHPAAKHTVNFLRTNIKWLSLSLSASSTHSFKEDSNHVHSCCQSECTSAGHPPRRMV